MNPILEQLNNSAKQTPTSNSNQLQKQQLKDAIKNFKALQNPQELILSNPNIKQAMDLIKAAGNPQAAFMQLAKQKGLTLEDIKDIFS